MFILIYSLKLLHLTLLSRDFDSSAVLALTSEDAQLALDFMQKVQLSHLRRLCTLIIM